MDVRLSVAALTLIAAATATCAGCGPSAQTAAPPARSQASTPATAAMVTGYPTSANTHADINEARDTVLLALRGLRPPPTMVHTTQPTDERIPADWWDSWGTKPNKVVVLIAPRGRKWAVPMRYTVVQAAPGEGWFVFRVDAGN